MAQEYVVDWVGPNTREWSGQHGRFVDYAIALAGDEGTVKLTQKPESPAPEVGQQLYGRIEEQTVTPQNGEPFVARKFKKERREDGAAPSHSGEARRGSSGGGFTPGPEFWAAKDARIGRQGLMQAVVASGRLNGVQDLGPYIKGIEVLVDALTESLDRHTPSPNTPAQDPSSGGDTGGTQRPLDGDRGAATSSQDTPAAPGPEVSEDLTIALKACGYNTSDPRKTWDALNPDQRAQVKTILENLKSRGEAEIPNTGSGDRFTTEPTTHALADDDEVPF